MPGEKLTPRKISIFWMPLAATWLMMATEGPFLAAIIARLAEPKFNLAAYGVAFSLGIFIEAPIIMIMSASTALVKDRSSYARLRNFTFALNGLLTLIMGLVVLPPVFDFLAVKLIGLPNDVAEITHRAAIFLLPWPGAIGYRRFYQGILIRSNLTRRVAYGTVVRLSTMAATALLSYHFLRLDGAAVGTLALAVGVTAEAAASRVMVHNSLGNLNSLNSPEPGHRPLSYRYIANFYYPLALTSVLALGIHPVVTFFLGKSRMAIESLAVMPVVHSLVFIFRSIGLSFQEVGIALLGEKNENRRIIEKFAFILGCAVFLALGLVAFTPLIHIWFHNVSGLSLELSRFAIWPTRIMVLMPALTVLLSYQRSILVNNGRTRPITAATLIEVIVIVMVLLVTLNVFDFIGAVGAVTALILGRLVANSYLVSPYTRVVRGIRSDQIVMG